ncbi:CCGSCS motif protein [Marinobacter fuscus]|uniref:CCGSCS motif protein n=1 Tax=Marinobacter fuscus TaxID=2109942 RepID=A0A2T1K314_9GAMM|nr:CCGSCS motif protein [Marinobacter fuscus]PSF04539.1 CCGSCS motif protein [Marinobacter fuscus]
MKKLFQKLFKKDETENKAGAVQQAEPANTNDTKQQDKPKSHGGGTCCGSCS